MLPRSTTSVRFDAAQRECESAAAEISACVFLLGVVSKKHAVLALLLLFLCPPLVRGVTAGEHMQAALRHFQAQDLQAAEASLRKAIELDGNSAQAWTLLGVLCERTGRLDEAVQNHNKALAIAPRMTLARNNLASVYYRQGAPERAAAEFQKTLEIDAADSTAHFFLGEIKLAANDYSAALDHFQAARRKTGDEPNVVLRSAQCYEALGRGSEAQALLESLARGNSQNPEVLFHIGSILLSAGKPAKAAGYLEKAAGLAPSHPAILVALAEARWRSGAAESAVLAVNQFVDALRAAKMPASASAPLISKAREVMENTRPRPEPSPQHDFLLAEILFLARDYQAAIRLLNSRARDFPADPDYFNLLGMSHTGLNQFDDAGLALTKALQLAPGRADLLFNAGTAYQKAGDNEKALETFAQVVRKTPDSAPAWFALGVSRFNAGNHAGAAADFNKALEIEPRFQEAGIFLARSLTELGKTQQAAQALEKALSFNPACADCHFRLALLRLETGQAEQAMGHLRQLIAIEPSHAEAHYQLGKILAQKDENNAAVEQLEKAIALDPELDAAYYQLGRLYAKLGNDPRAKELLEAVSRKKQERLKKYQDRVSSGANNEP